MVSKKAIALISAAVGAAVVTAGIFGIYRYFVTPERVIALGAINLYEKFDEALYYIDDDELDIIKDRADDGGKLSMDMTLSMGDALDEMPISVTSNSDGMCTVTDIKMYGDAEISIYKDSAQTLINTPLFEGGFSVDNDMFSEKVRELFLGSEYGGRYKTADSIMSGFLTGRYSFTELLSGSADELKSAAAEIEVRRIGSGNVMIDGSAKKANIYAANVTPQTAKRFISVLADHICAADGVGANERREIIDAFEKYTSGSTVISFRVRGNILREISIRPDNGDEYTAAFCGGGNPFDNVAVYRNGDTRNAVRRVLSRTGADYTDTIKLGDDTVFTAVYGKDGMRAKLDLDIFTADISAEGKTVTDDSVSYDTVDISIDDTLSFTGRLEFSEEYDEDFGFRKTGEYTDLLSISEDDWDAVSGTLLSMLELMGD